MAWYGWVQGGPHSGVMPQNVEQFYEQGNRIVYNLSFCWAIVLLYGIELYGIVAWYSLVWRGGVWVCVG